MLPVLSSSSRHNIILYRLYLGFTSFGHMVDELAAATIYMAVTVVPIWNEFISDVKFGPRWARRWPTAQFRRWNLFGYVLVIQSTDFWMWCRRIWLSFCIHRGRQWEGDSIRSIVKSGSALTIIIKLWIYASMNRVVYLNTIDCK